MHTFYYVIYNATVTAHSQFSIFVHKYNVKHHQISIQVLKVDKENTIKQIKGYISL